MLGSGVDAQVIYAEPSSNYRDHPITTNTSTISTSSPPSHTTLEPQYTVPTDVYTQPQVTGRIDAVSNAEYFYTQTKVTNCLYCNSILILMRSHFQGHYEFAIYVPTKVWRNHCVSTFTYNVFV